MNVFQEADGGQSWVIFYEHLFRMLLGDLLSGASGTRQQDP